MYREPVALKNAPPCHAFHGSAPVCTRPQLVPSSPLAAAGSIASPIIHNPSQCHHRRTACSTEQLTTNLRGRYVVRKRRIHTDVPPYIVSLAAVRPPTHQNTPRNPEHNPTHQNIPRSPENTPTLQISPRNPNFAPTHQNTQRSAEHIPTHQNTPRNPDLTPTHQNTPRNPNLPASLFPLAP